MIPGIFGGSYSEDPEDTEDPKDSEDPEDSGESRSLYYQWIEVFQHCSAEVTKMEPTLRSTQVLKQEAEDFGFQRKDIAEYVTRQQILDREERAA